MKTQKSYQASPVGKLYLVPTPIGNLDDMTFRAVQILKDVDLIAAEDTRNTQKLLNHFDIMTSQISYHEHNSKDRAQVLVERLLAGESIAQVSDAGMPSISDPGSDLVILAIDRDIPVIALPGPSAILPALISSGISAQPFTFLGFLPRKKNDLEEALESLKDKPETLVIYESPHRLKKFLQAARQVFGGQRKVSLARELTKKFEEFIRGDLDQVYEWTSSNQLRGEFVVIIEGNSQPDTSAKQVEWGTMTMKEHVEFVMEEEDLSSKLAIKRVSKIRNLPKATVYAAYHDLS